MKTQGTQPVKDQNDERITFTENEGPQEDESDHHESQSRWDPLLRKFVHEPVFEGSLDHPELQADVRAACRRALDFYGLLTHSSLERLERRVIRRFGRLLPLYPKGANRGRVLEGLAKNLLIRATKQNHGHHSG
jgi:hypothetical protein